MHKKEEYFSFCFHLFGVLFFSSYFCIYVFFTVIRTIDLTIHNNSINKIMLKSERKKIKSKKEYENQINLCRFVQKYLGVSQCEMVLREKKKTNFSSNCSDQNGKIMKRRLLHLRTPTNVTYNDFSLFIFFHFLRKYLGFR